MIRRFLTLSLPIFIVLTLMFPTNSMAITAEDRLIEVERQLQAIAEQISNYEGQLTDLENAILEKDKEKRLLKADISKKLLADYTAKINSAEGLEGLAKIASLIKKDKRKMELSHVHSLEIVYKEQNNSLSANIAPKEL